MNTQQDGQQQQQQQQNQVNNNNQGNNQQDQPPNPEPEALRNLMVNYIPTTIDEPQLRQIFEMYGPTESVKIVNDRESRTSKGYGFVKYRFAFSAAHAIQYLNGYPLLNKRLKVAYGNQAEAQRALAGHQQGGQQGMMPPPPAPGQQQQGGYPQQQQGGNGDQAQMQYMQQLAALVQQGGGNNGAPQQQGSQ